MTGGIMNLNDNQGTYSNGRSRAKTTGTTARSTSGTRSAGSGYSKSGSASRSSSSARSTASGRTGSAGRSTSSGRSNSGHVSGRYSSSNRGGGGRRGGGSDFSFVKLAVGGVVLIGAIACIAFLMKGVTGSKKPDSETEITVETTVPETELQKEVTVDGINITGMSREEARAAILKEFSWGMKVTWQDQSVDVADLMAGKVDSLLNEIYQGDAKESYSLDTTGLDDAVKAEVANIAAKWDKKAKNGSISSYDSSSDKFVFTGAETGQAVDQEKLASDIQAALSSKNFGASISATVNPVEPEFSEATAKEKYKTIASFTTKTTANSKRNTNVKLAAQAINGTVLQPGEEFSFNGTVGERTEAKGYKGAAAYNNGEVVEEIGGGVCQVSSTLYNAVLKAGLKTTVRRSHTFEPSYVTPGTDATVSWGGPDYKFVNNSSAAIGIRASYADQTTTVSIYAIPVLEEGVSYALKSAKVKDLDPPTPTYEEDPTLEPGVEKTKSAGSIGSYWETRLIVTKNGEVISDKVDHNVTYKGHNPVILRNTSGTVAATQPSEGAETTVDPSAPGAPGESSATSVTPMESSGSGTSSQPGGAGTDGPGGSTSAGSSSTTAAAQPTTAAQQVPQTTAAQIAPETAPASSGSGVSQAPGSAIDSNAPQLIAPMPGN